MQPLRLLVPDFDYSRNRNNEIYREDANALIRKITCDVLYIDPPYNSRQYSDAYHLLENLVEWKKPEVVGIGKKMDRSHIKSDYCLKNATQAFEDLIINAKCNHILLSYNNTGDSKDGRSNARMNDKDILRILKNRGEVEIFERDYRGFTTGKSDSSGNSERVFYCKITKEMELYEKKVVTFNDCKKPRKNSVLSQRLKRNGWRRFRGSGSGKIANLTNSKSTV